MGINQPRILQAGEVVSLRNTSNSFLISHSTFKADEFISVMQDILGRGKQRWFAEGVECEILTPSSTWQKGRVRICLEFCPEEPIADEPIPHTLETEGENNQDVDSPLDEIRLTMQEKPKRKF